MSQAPSGWYHQPDGTQRYWDGQQWTEHVAPGPSTSSAAPPSAGGDLQGRRPREAEAPAAVASGATATGTSPKATEDGPQGQPVRPWFKKKRILIPAGVAVLIFIGLMSGNKAPTSSPDAAPTAAKATFATGAVSSPTETANPSLASSPPAVPAPPPPPSNVYDDTFGSFPTVNKTGKGDAIVALPPGVKAAMVTMSYQGSSNFSVTILDANNQPTGDLLVNAIGKYAGSTAWGLKSIGNPAAKMRIGASGEWTLVMQPISQAPKLGGAEKGRGDKVFLFDGAASDWAITHVGKSNFAVIQTGGTFPNLAVNQIGNYNGVVPFSAGPSVVEITADGSWTLTKQ